MSFRCLFGMLFGLFVLFDVFVAVFVVIELVCLLFDVGVGVCLGWFVYCYPFSFARC